MSWDGKLGYIPARFIGKNKALIKSQLGMMSIENRQITELRWQYWNIEQLGKISSCADSNLQCDGVNNWYGTSYTYKNGNWLPAVTTYDNKGITHGNITQTFSTLGAGSDGNYGKNGVGSVEYVINRTISETKRVMGTTKNPSRPCIDYRYFNHTRDSASIAVGYCAPSPDLNNKDYGTSTTLASQPCITSYRGGTSFVSHSVGLVRQCGTEKVIYNNFNALGFNNVMLTMYAPYGYDMPMGLSANKNQADTSTFYGYNIKNNPRISVILNKEENGTLSCYTYQEGIGSPVVSTTINSIWTHRGNDRMIGNAYNTYNRECNGFIYYNASTYDWGKNSSFIMGCQDGVWGMTVGRGEGSKGGASQVLGGDNHSYVSTPVYLNFPSVSSPFNFSLEHKQIADFSHQPTMLEKKKLRT